MSGMPESEVARAAIGFAALLLRLSDFLLLSQEHIASALREDAIKRIRNAVGDRATVKEDELVDEHLSEVRPDLVIRSTNRDPVAVFLAQSAQRVNDAIFLQMAALYEAHRPVSVVAMLEADSSVSAKLRQRASYRLRAPSQSIAMMKIKQFNGSCAKPLVGGRQSIEETLNARA